MKNLVKIFILFGVITFASPKIYAQVSIGVRIRLAPPPLPVYVQPPCPEDGYLWEPGYWAYDNADGYYWVPGVWVAPPDPGLLWTPCYWGWDDGFYVYHSGYWGPHVGFYGGIDYGFGYPGYGFYGGVWSGRSFRYNTAVFNVNRTVIHNTYVDRSVIHAGGGNRASFNGRGGVNAQPRPDERRAMAEHHVQPTRIQASHQQMAAHSPAQHLSANHGRPTTPAVNRVNNRNFSQPAHAAPAAGHVNPSATSHNGRAANTSQAVHAGAVRQQHAEQQHAQQQRPQVQHMQQPRPEQQHMQQPRPEQPHMQQPRQEQPHMQQPRQEQPRMQQPRPEQQHMGGGGGGEPHGGGGGEPRGGHERH